MTLIKTARTDSRRVCTYCTRDYSCVGSDIWERQLECKYTGANSCVDRLNTEVAEIPLHGQCVALICCGSQLFSLLLGMVREKRDGKGDQKEKYFVVKTNSCTAKTSWLF